MTDRVVYNADWLSSVTPTPSTHTHIIPPSSREVVFHSVASIFYAPCSASAKTFTGLLIMCRYKGAVKKTTLPKPDTKHQSADPGCLYYVSTCCSICLSYSERMCTAVPMCAGLTLASQVPGLFPISLNLTTLEIITWNCPCFKDFSRSQTLMTHQTRSVPPGSVLPELIGGGRPLVFEERVFCQES